MATFFITLHSFEEITANVIEICSVAGQQYHNILKDFVILQLQQRGYLEDILMQDGALARIDRPVN